MKKLTGVFGRLSRRKVLVAGDFFLDTYTVGKARRISPEAPVAVVHVESQEHRPGGAGNVVLNLISLGASVVPFGRIGNDAAGANLKEAMALEGVNCSSLYVEDFYFTPIKNRIIADAQQIVRVDHEKVVPLSVLFEAQVVQQIPAALEGVEIVAISDYGKGFLSQTILRRLIDEAKARNILVIVDPKGLDFTKYQGCDVIKPNLGEAYAAAGLASTASLDAVADHVLGKSKASTLLVTRAEAGMSLFHREGAREDFPVRKREVKDVTGAGDTVLAMFTFALANKLSLTEAAALSNVAAGLAIERFGCARITLSELAVRLLEENSSHKVFDEEHLFALCEVLKERKYVLLELGQDAKLTPEFFQTLLEVKQKHQSALVVAIPENSQALQLIPILSALHTVDFILLEHSSVSQLSQAIAPEATYSPLSKKPESHLV